VDALFCTEYQCGQWKLGMLMASQEVPFILRADHIVHIGVEGPCLFDIVS